MPPVPQRVLNSISSDISNCHSTAVVNLLGYQMMWSYVKLSLWSYMHLFVATYITYLYTCVSRALTRERGQEALGPDHALSVRDPGHY